MGFEPMNNGFAGRRVSHFATRAHFRCPVACRKQKARLSIAGTGH